MGLRLRLVFVLIIPVALVVAVYGIARIRQETWEVLEAERRDAAATARAVQVAVENALRDRQISDIRRLVSEMVAEHAQIDRIRIFDRGLSPIVSEPPGAVEPRAEERLRRVLASGRNEFLLEPPRTLLYLMPLRGRGGRTEGALEIGFLSSVQSRQQRATREIAVSVSVLTAVLAVLIGVALQRQVLRPLSRLTASIRALGEGRPGPPVPVERPDELGTVAEAFNRMVKQLDTARQRIVAESERALDLEQQLRQAATLAVAGKLASGLAHEVGTPLNIISGRAEIVLHALPADHPARPELEVIVGQIDRISGIIRSLLDTVRPQKAEIQAVAVAPVLERLVPLLGHAARRRGVDLTTRAPADLPAVPADPGQLQQVLINLVMNALEATPTGGRIGVEAWACADEGRPGVAIAVRDTGSGIPADTLDKVFDPFFTTKPAGQGTGLGLSICRDIAREHGGTLAVDSHEGKGATFTLWLPRHEAPP
jgi:signal transduction histidine kinase